MDIRAAFVDDVARSIAEALGYDYDALPELCAETRNRERMPPKVDLLQAAEAAIGKCQDAEILP